MDLNWRLQQAYYQLRRDMASLLIQKTGGTWDEVYDLIDSRALIEFPQDHTASPADAKRDCPTCERMKKSYSTAAEKQKAYRDRKRNDG